MPKDLKKLKAQIAKDTAIKKNESLHRIEAKNAVKVAEAEKKNPKPVNGKDPKTGKWHLTLKKPIADVTKVPGVSTAFGILGATGSASARNVLGKVERIKAASKKGVWSGISQAAAEANPMSNPTALINQIKDAGKGAKDSVGGKSTSYSQVLESLGASKKVAALGGIPADIFLDPANYISLGSTTEKYLGGRAAEQAAVDAQKAQIVTKMVDKGLSVKTAQTAADHLVEGLKPRSIALKTSHGKVIGTSDQAIQGVKDLKDKLLGRTAPVEEAKNVASKYGKVEDIKQGVQRGESVLAGKQAPKINAPTGLPAEKDLAKLGKVAVNEPVDFQLNTIGKPVHNTNAVYETEQALRPSSAFDNANIPKVLSKDEINALSKTLEQHKALLASGTLSPDSQVRYEQVAKKIEDRLQTTLAGPTDVVNTPKTLDINQPQSGMSSSNTIKRPSGSNAPLNGLRENKLPVGTEPQQLSFSDVADTKGTAIDNAEKIAPNQHPIVKADNTGKKVVDFKTVDTVLPTGGQSEKLFAALDKVKAQALGNDAMHQVAGMFSTKVNMPVGLAQVKSRVYNGGLKQLEVNVKDVEDFFKKLTPEEDRLLARSIESGDRAAIRDRPLANDPTQTMGQFIDKFDQANKEVFDAEVAAGLRDPSKTPYNPDYVYHSYPGGENPVTKRQFKQGRKAEVKAKYTSQSQSIPGLSGKSVRTLQDAKAMGIKPIEEASKTLAARMIKSHSDLAHHFFVNEAVDKLGVAPLTKQGVEAAKAQGLVEIKDSFGKGTGQYVVPQAKQAIDYVDSLRRNPKAARQAGKLLNDFMGGWKLLNTGLRPGSHITNFVGDMWSSMASGVRSIRPIKEATSLMQTGGKDFGIVFKDGLKKREDFLHAFETQGSNTGFAVSDFNTVNDNPMASVLRSGPVQKVRRVSELREQYPRMVTFMDEMHQAAAEGKTFDVAVKRATDRVVTWHHDYGDLTPFEQGVKKFAVPFYTFMRKNTPLMLQTIMTKPGVAAMGPKVMSGVEKFLGTDPENQSMMDKFLPSWAKDLIPLTHSNESGDQIMYTDKIPMAEALRTSKDPLGALIQGLSPLIKMPIEGKLGKTLPDGVPAGSTADQLGRNLWPVKLGQTLTGKDKTSADKVTALIRILTGQGVQNISGKSKTYLVDQENQKLLKKLKAGG